ncbi:hypothetical protein [Dysgonomonas sp. ZJ279]|uniref:hypothetical protein n=1 Tax=Dysgonomonas sp. ZJ279 TaxID=2709796 RepID=UPI0013EC145B|nr:hypothetical protein [Dysgonomonas sp. ZJ279]
MAKEKLIGEVDQAQIDKWKADPKNKGVHGIVVGGHIGYVRTPDLNVISYALRHTSFKMSMDGGSTDGVEMNMGDMYKKGEAVLVNCWIGGSEDIRSNNKLYVGACMSAGNLIEYETAELKNF